MRTTTNKVTFLAFAASHPIMAFMIVNTICKTVKAVPTLVKEAAQAIKDIQVQSEEVVKNGVFRQACNDMFAAAHENGFEGGIRFDENGEPTITVKHDIPAPETPETEDPTEETEETSEAPASEEEAESLLS